MCGIAAYYSRNHQLNTTDSLNAMTHRGPDDDGEWFSTSKDVWLGHRRLSMNDLSAAGRQPMVNENGTCHLVCNGEIYNYPDLKTELEAKGHQFSSSSDSEIILHAYEEWGAQCLSRLTGMFAFAIWDENKQELFAARDRIGIKPLYYHVDHDGIALASEASALKTMVNANEINPLAMAYTLTLGYVPNPISIWQNIQKLEPGHYLIAKDFTNITTKPYWHLDLTIGEQDNENWPELITQILAEHTLSDVPIATFLSGGIDSSVVSLGLHEAKIDVKAITLDFLGSSKSERDVAEDFCKHLGLSQHILSLESKDTPSLMSNTMAAFDEPLGYSALLTMYAISEATKKAGYKVVLSGDGGDELFAGYRWYYNEETNTKNFQKSIKQTLRSFMGSPKALQRKAIAQFENCSPLHAHAWQLFPLFYLRKSQLY